MTSNYNYLSLCIIYIYTQYAIIILVLHVLVCSFSRDTVTKDGGRGGCCLHLVAADAGVRWRGGGLLSSHQRDRGWPDGG